MTTEPGTIHARLAAVLAAVGAIEKGRTNQVHGFKFRGVDDVYNELHALFAAQQIYVRPEVLHYEQKERQTSKGATQLHSVVKMRYHFCAPDGSSIFMEVPGEAADSGDKGLGKACQYAYKLCLLQMFLVPTEGDNDPDAHATEWGGQRQAGAKPAQLRKPAPAPAAEDPALVETMYRNRVKALAAAQTEGEVSAIKASRSFSEAQMAGLKEAREAAIARIRQREDQQAEWRGLTGEERQIERIKAERAAGEGQP